MFENNIKTADNLRYSTAPRVEPDIESECAEAPVDAERYNTCSVKAAQKMRVSVPVALRPFVFAGPASTYCLGEPEVENVRCGCRGPANQVCYLTINQKICVEVPINFGSKVSVGKHWVDCCERNFPDPCQWD